ncbi:TPA_asm: hexon [Anelosimus tangle-web spider MELD virus]|nr:TPA_asm: hexon [Anelosimus tangle-web spider MELD virus]
MSTNTTTTTMANDDRMVNHWLSQINLYNAKDELDQQALANPIEYEELNIQSQTMPDSLFSGPTVWNELSPITIASSNNIMFTLLRPDPILLNSIFFKVKVQISFSVFKNEVDILPMCDLAGGLFNCVKVAVGSNTYCLDNLDTHADIWHYVFRRLFNKNEYEHYIGALELLYPDTPGSFQFKDKVVPKTNIGGQNRWKILSEKSTKKSETIMQSCCYLYFIPVHGFTNKQKILAPYVPLRFELVKNDVNALFKIDGASTAALDEFNILDITCNFATYKVRAGAYDILRKNYLDNQTRFPPLELPINPYTNPTAIYDYFDVRAQRWIIPNQTTTFNQVLRMNSLLPKAIFFVIAKYNKSDKTKNHFEFETINVKSYSILVNGQPIKGCGISNNSDCGNGMADFYLRYRNAVGNYITNDTNGLNYLDFKMGTGIFAELLIYCNNLFIPGRVEVGSIEIKLEFKEAFATTVNLYTFLMYDQKLIIDKEFNGRVINSI